MFKSIEILVGVVNKINSNGLIALALIIILVSLLKHS